MALEPWLALIKGGFDSQAVLGKCVLLQACTRSADLMRALQSRLLAAQLIPQIGANHPQAKHCSKCHPLIPRDLASNGSTGLSETSALIG